jgi:hypothetical protein
MLRNGAPSSAMEASVFLHRRYVKCNTVSARVYPQSHCVQVSVCFVQVLSLLYTMKTEVKVNVNLRPTVSRSVRLGFRHPSGTRDKIFFLFEIIFGQLRVCYFVASSLTRGRVCNLLLLLALAIAEPLGSESPQDSRPYFIVPILETPPTWRARFPYLYPPVTGWPSYTPGHWVPFYRLLRLAELWWRYSNPPPHGEMR